MEAIPRLEAQEDIRLANSVALGSGTLKKGDARKLSRQLNRQASGGQVNRGLGMRAVAAMHGIPVIDMPHPNVEG